MRTGLTDAIGNWSTCDGGDHDGGESTEDGERRDANHNGSLKVEWNIDRESAVR